MANTLSKLEYTNAKEYRRDKKIRKLVVAWVY